MMKVAILGLENCMESIIIGPYDVLTVASIEWRRNFSHKDENLFEPSIITHNEKPVKSFTGSTISPTQKIDPGNSYDIIFIPVIYGELAPILSNKSLVNWLHDASTCGTIICSVCAGTFLSAQTGLLDGKSATTHWGLAEEFSKRFPHVTLKKEKMIVDEGNFISAGGVTAYMDMALYIAGRFGSAELISSLSKLLLIDPARRLQTPYKALDYNFSHNDSAIEKAQKWMSEHLEEKVSLSTLQEISGLEKRTLARRFKKATGNSLIEYLKNLRIGKARTLLEITTKSFDTITYEVGYEDTSSFRRLFKNSTGISPSAYRKQFGTIRG